MIHKSNLSNIDQIQQLEANEIQKIYKDELCTMLAHRMDDLIMQSMGATPTNKRLLRKYNELQKASTNINYYDLVTQVFQQGAESSPIFWKVFHLQADLDFWYSYAFQGLHNEISGHCRKDQRTYQRKFCAALARRNKFLDNHIEEFL